LAFEKLCVAHLSQIRRKLGISGIVTYTSSWRRFKENNGAQIDLVIDRADKVINLCEMKFTDKPYLISKDDDEEFRNRIALFQEDTKTRKTLHFTMVTPFGVKRNMYSDAIQSEVTMDDLFE